ncbi:MAG: VCBS repeat-containing protein [Acidobacteriota bacterium]|nr:VCBS repeat-containing protein [Acidobacteriota bacterium]
MPCSICLSIVCALALLTLSRSRAAQGRPDEIPFAKHTIDLGASETAVFADINHDGKLDIVSGEYWYEAPHWTKHRFRTIEYVNNYVDDLSTLPLDVDGDGYIDLVTSGWFSKKLAWWHNPGKSGGQWEEHAIELGSPIEFTFLVDLDNDGKRNEILPQFGDNHPLTWYERDGRGGIQKHVVSDRSYGHGIGVGDVNGDGRNDILTSKGWLEAPPDPRRGHWTFHPDWNLGMLGFMHVIDVNKDGRPDIVTSMAHDYGIFWLEHTADNKWVRHDIDDSWSQAHCVVLVDFRNSGNLGLLTGKRFMAHNGHDPGAREPLGVYWYERLLDNKTHNVEWAKHVLDYGGRIGGGIEIPVADIDGDGDLDFAVGGKSGLFLFTNKTHASTR